MSALNRHIREVSHVGFCLSERTWRRVHRGGRRFGFISTEQQQQQQHQESKDKERKEERKQVQADTKEQVIRGQGEVETGFVRISERITSRVHK